MSDFYLTESSTGLPPIAEARAALAMPIQRKLVLEYLQAGRTLTNLVAITNLGVGSLTSRIAELRAAGHAVKDEWREDFGHKRYKAYWIAKAEPQA